MRLQTLGKNEWARLLLFSLSLITLCQAGAPPPRKASFHGEISDRLIDVGDLNLFHAVWERFYEEQRDIDISSNREYQTYGPGCNKKFDNPDQTINVVITGNWGEMVDHLHPREKHLNHWQMRDTLMSAMWALVQRYAAKDSYTVWTNCQGEWWNEFYTQVPNAACGNEKFPHLPRCECWHKSGRHWESSTQCMKVNPGHRLPASFSIKVYDERGELRADTLTVEFHTDQKPVSNTRACGGSFGMLVGGLGEMLFSRLPVVGALIDRSLKLFCKGSSF